MKKILVFLALGLLLGACSGKLSSSKAEDLVKESLEENPMYGEIAIYTGEIKENRGYFTREEFNLYENLQKEGYLKMSIGELPVLDWRGNPKEGEFEKYPIISLTEKSKDYLLETQKKSYSDGNVYENTMKSYTAKMDKLADFHIVSEKEAEANVTFLKRDKTPFFPFEKDQTDFFHFQENNFYQNRERRLESL